MGLNSSLNANSCLALSDMSPHLHKIFVALRTISLYYLNRKFTRFTIYTNSTVFKCHQKFEKESKKKRKQSLLAPFCCPRNNVEADLFKDHELPTKYNVFVTIIDNNNLTQHTLLIKNRNGDAVAKSKNFTTLRVMYQISYTYVEKCAYASK